MGTGSSSTFGLGEKLLPESVPLTGHGLKSIQHAFLRFDRVRGRSRRRLARRRAQPSPMRGGVDFSETGPFVASGLLTLCFFVPVSV